MKPGATSLYVHWPFCEAKCPYCDFNSHVRERVDASAYKSALLAELDSFKGKAGATKLTSIFFGGGTPSLMPPDIPADIIAKAGDLFEFSDDMEITLEANPGSSEAAKFKAFEKAGVNRLSLGVQSLYDDALKFLGRVHNAAEARAAIKMASDTFPRFSFDLIYARPHQTPGAWREELEEALGMAGTHLSLYQLTLEKDTAFYRAAKRGQLTLPEDDVGAGLYELTGKIMGGAGLPAYEISNYAKPGHESRHNLNYWRGGQYLGIGPGAHGRYLKDGAWVAASTLKGPEAWLTSVKAKGHGLEEDFEVSAKERAEEIIMMALRLTEGLEKASLNRLTGIDFETLIDRAAVTAFINAGLLSETKTHLRTTPQGALLLDSLLEELLY